MIQDAAPDDDVYQPNEDAAKIRKDSGVHSPTGMSYGETPTNVCIMKGQYYEAYVRDFDQLFVTEDPFVPVILERVATGEKEKDEPLLNLVLKINTAKWVRQNFNLYKRSSLSTFEALRVQQQQQQYLIRAKHVHSPLRQEQASHAMQPAATAPSIKESC